MRVVSFHSTKEDAEKFAADLKKTGAEEVEVGKKTSAGYPVLSKASSKTTPEDIYRTQKSRVPEFTEEYPYETVESILVQTADQISGARPGARKDTLENYLKRLGELENLALQFEGVEKAWALQAGREIRVFVKPEEIDDLAAKNLARGIAKRIQEELRYPGEIKVNVIRETRVIEYAK